MCGHELCGDGVYFIPNERKSDFHPEKYLGNSLVNEKDTFSENLKDKVISDLTAALKHYAGVHAELALGIETDFDLSRIGLNAFSITDRNGVVYIARGEVVAQKVLREYNIIEQEKI